ncbi:hypothetical protein GGS20DRAFT_308861 [Poronia punctata]|nr:hypothetical protein GGS20DRAFT_308861 [Poronia punctata]
MPFKTPATPVSPRNWGARTEWHQLCEITAHRILHQGFNIEYLRAGTSVQLGAELGTGVVLVISTGTKSVRRVQCTWPGITEGLEDMAQDGLDGKLIIYGLAFYFAPAGS